MREVVGSSPTAATLMKLAIFSDLPFGGAKVATRQLITHLSKKKKYQIQEFNLNFSPSHNRFLSDLYALTTARKLQKQLANYINHNFDLALISHTRFFQAPWILRYLTIPTAFLCQEPTRAFFEDFLKPKHLPLPNLVYEHTIRFIKKKIEITNAQFPQIIIANSHFSANQIKKAYQRQAIPLLLGVDTRVFKPLKLTKLNQVLIVGNDEPQKNLDFAFQIIASINESIRPTLVVVSPRQNHHQRLTNLAKKLQIQVTFKSHLTTSELVSLYNQSLVTLAVAIKEPFGLSVVESMACGTPVIAVNEGGFKETIVHQKTGFLLPRDVYLFANQLTQLLYDRQLLDKLSHQARQHVESKFTWSQVASNLDKILTNLVNDFPTID